MHVKRLRHEKFSEKPCTIFIYKSLVTSEMYETTIMHSMLNKISIKDIVVS